MVGDIKTALFFNGVEGLWGGGEYGTGICFDSDIGPYRA